MKTRESLYRLAIILLILSALDFTTALIPTPADHLWPLPKVGPLRLVIQGLLLVPLLIMTRRWPMQIWSSCQKSGASLPVRISLLLFVSIASIHVALRQESFPFSPVTMFSSGVTPRTSNAVVTRGYLVVTPEQQLVPFRSFLEGNAWFGRYETGWDYKTGWVMHLFGYSFSKARDKIFELVDQSEDLQVKRTPYVYDRRNGKILSPQLIPNKKDAVQ